VRPGSGVFSTDGSFSAKAGEEFTIPESEAANYLHGKARRSFEVVEVFEDETVGTEGDDSGPRKCY
jgi:hypothetical protein